MNIKDYIQGKRHGKEANELERKAMNDAFLQEALDGFDAVQGEHLPVMEKLEKQITATQTTKKAIPIWRWVAAAVAFLLIGTSLLEIFNFNDKNLPQVASVKPKIETSAIKIKDSIIVADNIQVKNISKKISVGKKTSVTYSDAEKSPPSPANNISEEVNITSLLEKSVSDDENGYISLTKKDLHFGSNSFDDFSTVYGHKEDSSREKIAGLNVTNNTDDTFWLKNDSIKINPTLSREIAKTDILNYKTESVLSGKVAGLNVKHSKEKEKEKEKVKIRGVASISNPQQMKISKGRILDENGEPLIGASVMVKGTNNGVTTNFNGEFLLPFTQVISGDSMLVASYIGYEKQEIPIKNEVGDIQLLADNKTLNEVVVIGYGIQKRSSTVGSVSSTSTVVTKKYVFSEKEFIDYFKHYYDKSLCSGEKTTIKVTFKLDENGHPSDITKLETNCPKMEAELKKWLEKSPNWTKKNKIVTLKINL